MENEINIKDINLYENIENEKIFKIDYDEQNLNNNIEYQKWKKSMIKYYGKNAKLFRCLNDKILFFNTYNKNINFSSCFIKCPICKDYICHFCSYSSNNEFNKCCLKREIVTLLIFRIPEYAKNEFKWTCENFIFLIPGFNFFSLYCVIYEYLVFEVIARLNKQNKNGELKLLSKENKIYLSLVVLTGILIGISFLIFNTFFIIFMILISIPFKMYPIKYMISIIISY